MTGTKIQRPLVLSDTNSPAPAVPTGQSTDPQVYSLRYALSEWLLRTPRKEVSPWNLPRNDRTARNLRVWWFLKVPATWASHSGGSGVITRDLLPPHDSQSLMREDW